jgi:VCBS repeat-containing protein
MERCSYITLACSAHLAMLVMFLAVPAPVMSQTIHITTIEQFQKIGDNASYPLNGYYVLDGDIDASETRSWNGGEGFAPIGASSIPFSGALDGQGYAISNLYINRGGSDYVGLFGYVSGELATISNVDLDNATITGRNYTGALMGYNNNCLIKKCSSTGSVSANSYVGGLVGRSQASQPFSISNCYSTSAVSGNGGVGGLVGYNVNTPISTCYSAGKVSGGESWVGGLIGYNTAPTSNCFWDNNTSGQKTSAGGVPKSTADMKKRSTFVNAGWDFTSVWGIADSKTYPFFRGANDLPQAEPDAYTVGIHSVLSVAAPGVLYNDSDADGDPLTAKLVTGPSHGTLALKSDGSFTYTPENNFKETDSFTYQALAGGDSTTAVTVTLIIGNTAPVAVSDIYSTNRYLPVYIPEPGVLGNDTDPSGDPLTALLVSGPFHGKLVLRESGSFSYKPDKGFIGTDNFTSDNFTYIANDGELDSPPATVIIQFIPLCPLESLFPDNASEIITLRRYRDEVLARSAPGRAFINFYYRLSPLADGILKNSTLLQRMTRKIVSKSLPWVQERLIDEQ